MLPRSVFSARIASHPHCRPLSRKHRKHVVKSSIRHIASQSILPVQSACICGLFRLGIFRLRQQRARKMEIIGHMYLISHNHAVVGYRSTSSVILQQTAWYLTALYSSHILSADLVTSTSCWSFLFHYRSVLLPKTEMYTVKLSSGVRRTELTEAGFVHCVNRVAWFVAVGGRLAAAVGYIVVCPVS